MDDCCVLFLCTFICHSDLFKYWIHKKKYKYVYTQYSQRHYRYTYTFVEWKIIFAIYHAWRSIKLSTVFGIYIILIAPYSPTKSSWIFHSIKWHIKSSFSRMSRTEEAVWTTVFNKWWTFVDLVRELQQLYINYSINHTK